VSSSFIVLGVIGKPHGIKGCVKINSYTEPRVNIIQYQPWQLKVADKYHLVHISGYRMHADRLIASLPDCHTPEQAKIFTGCEICIQRTQLPPLDEMQHEYYWTDLQGLAVYNTEGICLGRVDHLFATGSNDVLVVVGKKRHLIPFLWDQIIEAVDREQGIIRVVWDPNF